jgi:hypothetical protein
VRISRASPDPLICRLTSASGNWAHTAGYLPSIGGPAHESSSAEARDRDASQLPSALSGWRGSVNAPRSLTAHCGQRPRQGANRSSHRRRTCVRDAARVGAGLARRRRGKRRMIASYASPKLRDQFLAALDADDRALFTQLAIGLTRCMNPLPGMTCDQLGLPIGSTYGSAARHVLLQEKVPCRVTASATASNAEDAV